MDEDDKHLRETAEPFLDEIDEVEEAKLDAEAEADIAAGRVIPHEDVAAWLDTWGKGERVPPPKSWLK